MQFRELDSVMYLVWQCVEEGTHAKTFPIFSGFTFELLVQRFTKQQLACQFNLCPYSFWVLRAFLLPSLCIFLLNGFFMFLLLLRWLKGNFSWQHNLLFEGLYYCCLWKDFPFCLVILISFKIFFCFFKQRSFCCGFCFQTVRLKKKKKKSMYVYHIYKIHIHTYMQNIYM